MLRDRKPRRSEMCDLRQRKPSKAARRRHFGIATGLAATLFMAGPANASPFGMHQPWPERPAPQAALEGPHQDVRNSPARTLEQQLAARGLRKGAPIFIRVFKETSELEVWVESGAKFKLFKVYPICNYSGELGPKLQEGDGQSPEGFYFVTPGAMNPNSRFHLSFNLGFPNAYDRAHDRTGSHLMVHGSCYSIGCYAMTDPGIEEIFGLAKASFSDGQKFFRVHAFPFRMTKKRMAQEVDSEWISFWRNLREGYVAFERTRVPPNVRVDGKRYVFDVKGL